MCRIIKNPSSTKITITSGRFAGLKCKVYHRVVEHTSNRFAVVSSVTGEDRNAPKVREVSIEIEAYPNHCHETEQMAFALAKVYYRVMTARFDRFARGATHVSFTVALASCHVDNVDTVVTFTTRTNWLSADTVTPY